jgi:AraC family transcriptional regulator
MNFRIETLPPKKIVGLKAEMTLANNRTAELWRNFMPRRKEIANAIDRRLYSLQVYGPQFSFSKIDATIVFEKWAAVEVTDFDSIPPGMASREFTGGLYAVFHYQGPASDGAKVFQYIFGTWLPDSGYAIDDREHFELLDERYKGDAPDSEEEIWIPVKIR